MKTAAELNEIAKLILEEIAPEIGKHAQILASSSNALLSADEDTLADIGAKEGGRCRSAYEELIALAAKLAEAVGR